MSIETLTFDCYGTLVDWEGGIHRAFQQALSRHGIAPDGHALLEAYSKIEPQVEEEAFRSYRDVLQETAWRIAQRFGWPLTQESCTFLPDSLVDWQPFPDTVAALKRLAKSGVRLGILSNVDDDLLAGTLAKLGVEFPLIVTAEQVRSYKPAPVHFEEARRRIEASSGNPEGWWHAAQSRFHDIAPAVDLDLPVIWVNRKRECVHHVRPDLTVDDLAGLARAVVDGDPPVRRRVKDAAAVQSNPG